MSSEANRFSGGCLCGAVRYECGAPLIAPVLCHCASCRRATGAHAVAWMTVRGEDFRYTRGSAAGFASSPGVVRGFCAACGSSLTYRNENSPGTIDVTIATLDDPAAIRPQDHIWMSDAVAWDRPGDGLPEFAGWRKKT